MENRDRQLTIAIVLSLLLHLLLVSSFPLATLPPERPESEIELTLEGKEIADISPPEQEERPDLSRFLGLYDSKVDEEQVAVSPYTPPSRRRIVTGPDGREIEREEGMEHLPKSPEIGPLRREEGEDLYSILPEEFFPDLKIGDRTYLSVQREDRIQYFVGLKKRFKMTWDPVAALRMSLVYHQLVFAELTAAVAFRIDQHGNLQRLFLARSSGIPEYDEEALRVVTASAPFEVPPRFLLKWDGHPDNYLDLVYYFMVIRS